MSGQSIGALAVIGAGAWGTALANIAAANGARVLLAARNEATATAIHAARENRDRLPGVLLHERIEVVAGIDALPPVDAFVYVAPAQAAREHIQRLARRFAPTPTVIAAKGVELETGLFLPEVLAGVWPGAAPAMLSGPTFAHDLAAGRPAAATLACTDETVGAAMRAAFARPEFRLYPSSDVLGVALGGAAKNVLAIAAGVVTGAGLGESARAAIIARGFAETRRLGAALGADPSTLVGLSGLGDLILTATSTASRNMSLGVEIGAGASPVEALAARSTVSEGALTAGAILKRAAQVGVEMPVCRAVADLIAGARPLGDIVGDLLSRPAPVAAG